MSSIITRLTRYVVISPIRDEAEYLEQTLASMVRQTVLPIQWILVNDGSTDGTAQIIDQWALRYDWMTVVHLPNRGNSGPQKRAVKGHAPRGIRAQHAKEIEAFHEGYKRLIRDDWNFVVKLDGDLAFEPHYFEKCLAEFNFNPKLGIGGGVICHRIRAKAEVEHSPLFHVRGATKIYRRECWNDIGGVRRGAAWDTVDEVKANMMGWQTRSFGDLRVTHLRFTGAANGAWKNAVKNGIWSYVAGYHPLFMIVRCTKRIAKGPYILGAIGLMCGYLQGYLLRVPRTEDEDVIGYLRKQQIRRLSFRTNIWK